MSIIIIVRALSQLALRAQGPSFFHDPRFDHLSNLRNPKIREADKLDHAYTSRLTICAGSSYFFPCLRIQNLDLK